jgi:(1->4)-alpha-D-glucan 1-alpha-D-glucosylmutase
MAKTPLSTYRIQFNSGFGFKEALAIMEYLSALGISDVYASPIFKARRGSSHGYDIVDSDKLNPELGSREDLDRLTASLKNRGMGWIQDIVPNHMAVSSENHLLMDVLENGSCSDYFNFFDIEWNHPYETIRGRLLAPFLGRLYGEALEEGELGLKFGPDGFSIRYYDLELPLKIESYLQIVSPGIEPMKDRLGEHHPDYIKLAGTAHSLKNLSSPSEVCAGRNDQILFIKRILWELYLQNVEIKEFIDGRLARLNGEKGLSESFNLLHGLLSEQNFRLSFWKVAAEEINYRRFFNINDLISLRMEEEEVFKRFHSLVSDLIQDQTFTGLRIDHIDGLYDPTAYLLRLRELAGEEPYLVVEKVLLAGETLPDFWPVQGTTGYDFVNLINEVFCQQKNEKMFDKIYSSFSGLKTRHEEVLYEERKLIAEKYMIGDADNIAHLFKRILSKDRHGSDLTIYGLKRAIIEIITLFPVYRTYISTGPSRESDPLFIQKAVERARRKSPGLLKELNFVERVLLLQFAEYLSEKDREEWLHFVMKFQQFTGPNMAKGLEDTTYYVYNRLLSLNEVGGDPGEFGMSLEKFHEFNRKKVSEFPHSLNATSTHDTKRGEDGRARISVLSEMPAEWMKNFLAWNKMNRREKRKANDREIPEKNGEYFLYQTLLGAFPSAENEYPAFLDRIKAYIVKSIREAKVHTAWLKPDVDYEDGFVSFVEEILTPSDQNEFLRRFLPFQKKVAYYGMFNSLSQTLMKITCPGVPDFYQGTELWDLNLVDPDNRRPVDFEKRKSFLIEIVEKSQKDILGLISDLLATWEDGRVKLFLIFRALKARRERTDLFGRGAYFPAEVKGQFEDHLIAFSRREGDGWAIMICPRFLTGLVQEDQFPFGREVWGDTRLLLPEDAPLFWKEAITGEENKIGKEVLIGDILRYYPVAMLVGDRK